MLKRLPPWLLRGLGMALLHTVAAVALAKVAVYHATEGGTITVVVLAVLVGVTALWSAIDAWLRLRDRGMVWLFASVVAGLLSGLLTVIGKATMVDQTGMSALGSALTAGAAFTALLVLIPAGFGLFVGGRMRPPEGVTDEDDDDADQADESTEAVATKSRDTEVRDAGDTAGKSPRIGRPGISRRKRLAAKPDAEAPGTEAPGTTVTTREPVDSDTTPAPESAADRESGAADTEPAPSEWARPTGLRPPRPRPQPRPHPQPRPRGSGGTPPR